MPNMRAEARMSAKSARALLVALVFVFNFFVSSFGGIVFAETAEETPSEITNSEVETTPTETTITEVPVEVTEAPVMEVVIEETPQEVVTEDTQVLVAEMVAPSTVEDEPEEPISLPALTASFDCWVRTGLTEYRFAISVMSESDYTFEQGSALNHASPSTYDSLLPVDFVSGSSTVQVEGWDGVDFTWTLGDNVFAVSLEGSECTSPTIAEVVSSNDELTGLNDLLYSLSDYKVCSKLFYALNSAEAGPFTVFAPSNSALATLVGAPATTDTEMAQLQGNPDELCALIESHIVEGEFTSADINEDGVVLDTLSNDQDGLFVQLVGDQVYVDGAVVTQADLFATNGVVHVVDSVLLPQSVGTIDPIETDLTSPALSGTISEMMIPVEDEHTSDQLEYCVVVRIDGVPYIATVTGNTWMIESGIVSLNPTKADTLFDVVVRICDNGCEYDYPDTDPTALRAMMESEVVTNGQQLLGLTMNRGIVSYPPTEEEEPEEETVVDDGEVLSEVDDRSPIVEKPEQVALVSTPACAVGKSSCDGSSYDPSTVDSDGDGVVDSEDSAPFDPDVTGQEDDGDKDDKDTEDNEVVADKDQAGDNVIWWFLAGGGIVAAWYLLWQRSAREE